MRARYVDCRQSASDRLVSFRQSSWRITRGDFMHSPLLGPVVALVAWTTLFRIWMALRHNAAAKRAAGDATTTVEQNPYSSALWEQPTRFYAIVFALMFMGFDAPINVWLAWAYVAFR